MEIKNETPKKSKGKFILITIISVVTVAAIGIGILFATGIISSDSNGKAADSSNQTGNTAVSAEATASIKQNADGKKYREFVLNQLVYKDGNGNNVPSNENITVHLPYFENFDGIDTDFNSLEIDVQRSFVEVYEHSDSQLAYIFFKDLPTEDHLSVGYSEGECLYENIVNVNLTYHLSNSSVLAYYLEPDEPLLIHIETEENESGYGYTNSGYHFENDNYYDNTGKSITRDEYFSEYAQKASEYLEQLSNLMS